LAAIEDGHPECSDLEGVEHWVRKALDLKGYFRWDAAIVKACSGDEAAAYKWAVKALKAYRTSKGPGRAFSFQCIERESKTANEGDRSLGTAEENR
jgi:hypothetical protein